MARRSKSYEPPRQSSVVSHWSGVEPSTSRLLADLHGRSLESWFALHPSMRTRCVDQTYEAVLRELARRAAS